MGKRRNSDIPPEMGEILDSIKKKVNEFTWGVDKISDYKALKMLAEKIKIINKTAVKIY